MTRIVAVSDTHGFHRRLDIPAGDIFVHAGDITRDGEMSTALDFANWVRELPHKHKCIVFGDHDFCYDISSSKFNKRAEEALYEAGPNVHVLMDSIRVIEGSSSSARRGFRDLAELGTSSIAIETASSALP